MKLLLILGLFAASTTLAPAAPPQKSAVAATNVTSPAPRNVASPTNSVKGTSDTNEVTVAKPPGDNFTNSVDMALVKVGTFWAGKCEVTQKEYLKIMGANPSAFPGEKNPVDSVSWDDAVAFCRKLTERDVKELKLPEGWYYTLPTESEWESLVADATLADAVTSDGGTRSGTAPVGSLKPNSLGLYDVLGNVLEFCLGEPDKSYRVLRGSSWQDWIEVNLRVEFRHYCPLDDRQNTYGFRVVLKGK